LTKALHDDGPHVRVHVTQCLERMGPRGQAACGELVRALDEPHMASSAAAALASVGCADAVEALVKHTLAGNAAEIRDASATALGQLGGQGAVPALRALLASTEPLDLRQAAAQSLVALGDDPAAAKVLVECLTTPGADPGAAETALEAWLMRREKGGDAAAKEELDRWRKLAGGTSETPTAAQSVERQKKRAAMMSAGMQSTPTQSAPR
jgi:HEAT repeat protein